MQEFDVSVSFRLLLTREMDSGEKIDFEASLTEHTKLSIESSDFGDEPLLNLNLASDIGSQTRVETTPATLVSGLEGGNRRLRMLQEAEIVVAAVVRIRFQSVTTRDEDQVESYIGDAFNTATERNSFVDRLVALDGFFSSMQFLEVLVAGEAPQEEEVVDASTTANSNTIYIILGAAGGGFAALVALGLLAFRRSSPGSVVTPPEEIHSEGNNEQKVGVTTEILVNGQDEVSTLGDPVFGQAGMMTANAERDEQTASVGNDYDYTKQYLRAQGLASLGDSRERLSSTNSFEQTRTSSSQSGFSKLGGPVAPSVFSDDASFEQQFGFEAVEQRFEVTVPAGKLGMVIDTPNGGVPVVHAIKAESCLASKVKVGDRLVAVDGDDVTAMTAVQVSKLISLKSDQERMLAFIRGGVDVSGVESVGQ